MPNKVIIQASSSLMGMMKYAFGQTLAFLISPQLHILFVQMSVESTILDGHASCIYEDIICCQSAGSELTCLLTCHIP